jgi:prevent-host-death family protein
MKTVGSRELKNRLGRYLKLVGQGETLIITDRGKPVARLLPPSPRKEEEPGMEEILQQLEAEGHLRRGTGRFKPFKPVSVKGKPVSRMILEDRE